MGQWVYLNGKLNLLKGGAEKSNIKYVILVIWIRPETKWSNHEQAEIFVEIWIGGPNPCMWKNTGMICD